jgi:hypothetical protein
VLLLSWVPALLVLTAAGSASLQAAEQAYDQGRYEAVLPAVDQALDGELSRDQRVRAFELQAMAHAAFGDSGAAVQSFRRLLGVDSTYTPTSPLSPKLNALLADAQRQGAVRLVPEQKTEPPVTPVSVTEEPARPFFKSPWFWTAAAAVVVAGGAAAVAYTVTRPPVGSLGIRELQ